MSKAGHLRAGARSSHITVIPNPTEPDRSNAGEVSTAHCHVPPGLSSVLWTVFVQWHVRYDQLRQLVTEIFMMEHEMDIGGDQVLGD